MSWTLRLPRILVAVVYLSSGAAIARAEESMPQPAADEPTSEAPAEPQATPTAKRPKRVSEQNQIEEIVVTAQKRREKIVDIPFSMTSIGGDQIDVLQSGGLDIRMLSVRIPSLTVESSFGRTFPRFYMRGLGNTDFDLNASQPVSLILDDIVLENPTLKGFPLFDVDRIEILRGPQGTLFGRNTPAGIVKVDSRKPTSTEDYARMTYGSFDFVGMESGFGGPVVKDLVSTRLSMLFERQSDWVGNSFTGKLHALGGFQEAAGRFQLLFTPLKTTSALLNVHAHSLDGTARIFRANIIKAGTDQLVDDFKRDEVAQDGQNRQIIKQAGASLTLTHDAGPATLTSITGYEGIKVYSRGDIDGGYGASFAPPYGPGFIPFPSETADAIPKLRQITEELRLASNDWEMVNFQVGGYYFYEDLFIQSFDYNTLAGGVEDGYARQHQETTAMAGFGTVTVEPIERVRLAAGARYTNDQRDFSAWRLTSPFGAGAIGPLTANPDESYVSWDASATYLIDADTSVFARVAKGFRAPSIQGRILFGDTISVAKSEKILSYEAGTKAALFENRMRLNAAAFYYTVRDQQLTAVGGQANFNTLINADKSIGYGFEMDAQAMPVAGLYMTLGASYNYTEIKDANLAVATCGGGCTVTDELNADGDAIISGNPLPHAPRWILNATARYSFPVSEDAEVFAFTDWAYRSRVNFFLYESKEFTDPSLLEGSLRLGYSKDFGRMELAAFVRNILDDVSRTGGIDFDNLTGFVNGPRFFGVEGVFRY